MQSPYDNQENTGRCYVMLFKPSKKQKQNTKEFMKYEDGKIVTMEVEKPRKPDIYIDENFGMQEEQQLKHVKKMGKEKLKPFMTLKVAKKIGLIIVLILFLFALYDVYKNFFGAVPEENPPTTIVEKQPTAPATPTLPKEQTNPSSQTEDTAPSPNEPSESNNETHPLAKNFEVISTVNNVIVEESSFEVQQVKNYADRKANKVGTARQIEKSLKTKEELYVYLSTHKELFESSPLSDLYLITEERLLSSILFSKELHSGIEQMVGRDVLLSMTEKFIPKDEEIRERGVSSMLKTLEHYQIPHQYNEVTEEIQYTLK